jgi:hypothetical protein
MTAMNEAAQRLPPNIRPLLASRSAKLLEKRGATFWGFMTREIKRAVLGDRWFHIVFLSVFLI